MLAEFAVFTFCLYCIWYVYSTMKERKTLPPGPFPLPLIGNAHLVGKDMPSSLQLLGEKYGDVFTLRVPSGNFIVVNSGRIMQEMLVKSKDDFANRPSGSRLIARDLFKNKSFPFSPYGPFYLFCRKVITHALHMYGEGVKTAENRVQHEVKQLMVQMEKASEAPFCPIELLYQTITNVTTSWLIDQRYDYGDPIFKKLRKFVDDVIHISHQWINLDFLPFYEYLPLDMSKRFWEAKKLRDEYFGKFLEEHRGTYKVGEVRDIVDALLAAYEAEKLKTKGKDVGTSDDIQTLLMDFLIASSDTTTSTLSWFLLYMVLHQEVQKKLHEELDSVIGRDHAPSYKETDNLPFLQATICETIRHASPVPLLGRKALRDTKIKEYEIPQDTRILLNMWCVNNDPKEWKDPLVFDPTRFLDENGKFRGWNTSASFYPFGAGIRSCLGQSLAKMNLLVVTSNLLHYFHFGAYNGDKSLCIDSDLDGVLYPKDFLMVASKRIKTNDDDKNDGCKGSG